VNLSCLQMSYELLGTKPALSLFTLLGTQTCSRETRARLTEHFADAFRLGAGRATEPETPPEAPETLNCTETGQVSHALNALSVFDLHAQFTQHLPPGLPVPRNTAEARALQDEIRARFVKFLRLPEPAGPVKSEVESHSCDAGFEMEKGRLFADEGLFIPYSFYALPSAYGGGKPLPAVLVLHEHGIAGVSAQQDWLNALAESGANVMAVDVAGIGETRLQAHTESDDAWDALLCGPEALWARRALAAGLSLFGLRVFSVLRALAYLRTRWDVKRDKISIAGTCRGALWGLYAAALDGEVSSLTMLRSLGTYKSLLNNRWHSHSFSLFLPGCLKQFDLPHVAAVMAPRPLTILNAVDAEKRRREAAGVQRDYALTAALYRALDAGGNFKILNTDAPSETLAAFLNTCNLPADKTNGET
jgi:hypothetical protein